MFKWEDSNSIYVGLGLFLALSHYLCDATIHSASLQCHHYFWPCCFRRHVPPASCFIFIVKFQEFRQSL